MPRKKIPEAVIEAAHQRNDFVPRKPEESDRRNWKRGPSRIMYIEYKSGGLAGGEARIGRVTFSKTRSTIYYEGRAFRSLKGSGYKANYVEMETGAYYWISGPKKNGADRLYGERVGVAIDEDVRAEYWTDIRGLPERRNQEVT
jgi:hypothetical protein